MLLYINSGFVHASEAAPHQLLTTEDATPQDESNAAPLKQPLGSKTLRLRYALGGVNFAHHDACGDFQALLMLTEPGVDYRGGCFYLLDTNPPFTRTEYPFTAAGQLLVFRSNKGNGTVDYFQGMTEVTAGSASASRTFAVGFFQ